MTNPIADSWELPSYLAGDLYDMTGRRRNSPLAEPVPGQQARVFDLDFTRDMHKRREAPPESEFEQPESWLSGWNSTEPEPYDPSNYLERNFYDAGALDRLHGSGFTEHEPGQWHRDVPAGGGANFGIQHIVTYNPGHRRPSDNALMPWHLTTDPDEIGTVHPTVGSAIKAADADSAQIQKNPKEARRYLAMVKLAVEQSRGRQNADDWLAQNSDESFEHDPREEARRWMDEHAGEYDTWHPQAGDYTYPDFGDTAGQSFNGEGEGQSHVLPGSHYHPDADWETGLRHEPARSWSPQESDDHEQMRDHHPDLGQRSEYDQDDDENLTANHGFNWEPQDSTAGTPGNPLTPETPGKYVKHQIDTEGNHVATHTITPGGHQTGQWTLHTEVGNHGLPVTFPESVHGTLDWALHKYKQNSAEAMLPRYGYDYERGPGGGVTHWTKSTPHPAGEGHEDIQHEISFPDHGFLGQTENVSNGSLFAPNGNQAHHSEDLTDVVREQSRLERGIHPGGMQDFRMHPTDLAADPSVASLGHPETTSTPWGDNRVNRMTWRIPHAEAPHGVNAEANYNWDTGNYDFGYTHNGAALSHTHNYVPAGAPVRVPGRQPRLPLESAR